MTTELWQMSATALGQAYRKGTLKPSQVHAAIEERADESDPVLNLFATRDSAGAGVAARASDARFATGEPLGPLDGIPVTIKDNIPVKGLRCAWGSNLYLHSVPERDELPVVRLRQQGAVLLGKTNVSEFTMGRGNVHTLVFGTTRNPWNPDLTPGASTGGGAAAVAVGVGPVALGTDGGGSIRRPAAYNGIVGLKPSVGRVARIDSLPQILHDFEIVGPLARTVDDLALTLSAIEGPHIEDRRSLGFEPGGLTAIEACNILYVPSLGATVEEPIAASCAAVAENLARLGHKVIIGGAPFDVALFERHWPVIGSAGMAWLLRDTDWEGKIGIAYPPMIESGQKYTAMDYIDALAAFGEIYRKLAQCLEEYDFIMTPTAGAMPWKAEDFGPAYHRAFTGFVNAAGLPAISVPAPPSDQGLPIGFQLIAPFGGDWRLLSLARDYERANSWGDRWPEPWSSQPA